MTTKDMFEKAFPQEKQIGGSHYKSFHIQPQLLSGERCKVRL